MISSAHGEVAVRRTALHPSSTYQIRPPISRHRKVTLTRLDLNSASGVRLLQGVQSSRRVRPSSIQTVHQSPSPILPLSSGRLCPTDVDSCIHVDRLGAST